MLSEFGILDFVRRAADFVKGLAVISLFLSLVGLAAVLGSLFTFTFRAIPRWIADHRGQA